MVVVCPPNSHPSLLALSSVQLNWNTEVLGQTTPVEPPCSDSNLHPPVTPYQPRTNSTNTSHTFLPSRGTEADDDDADEHDDDLYIPRHDTYLKTTQPNGFSSSYIPSRYTFEPLSGRRSPSSLSWGTPKPYSPSVSFRSVKTSPPIPPVRVEIIEPSFPMGVHGIFDRASSKQSLPKGFPLDEPESITFKGRVTTFESSGESSSRFMHNVSQAPPVLPKQTEVEERPAFILPTTIPALDPALSYSPEAPSASLPDEAPAPVPVVKLSPIISSPVLAAKTATPSQTAVPVTPKPEPAMPISPTASAPPLATTSTKNSPAPQTPRVIPPAAAAGPSTARPPAPVHINPIASHFKILIDLLEARRRSQGGSRIVRTDIGSDLAKYKAVYTQAGVSSFARYIELAQRTGIVDVGGAGNNMWVELRPEWSSNTDIPCF